MKKENGFTLVELLAVIVILAIILIIAVPGVLSIINKTKDNALDRQKDMIKEATRLYITSDSDVTWVGQDTKMTTVSLDVLKAKGYLDQKILDPKTKKEITCAKTTITKNGSKYEYDVTLCDQVNRSPRLSSNMIPIVYQNNKWVKADPTNKNNNWYDYENQQWANMVTVTESIREAYKKAEIGTEVKMEDINAMFVWIPRFKYKLWNVDGTLDVTNNLNLAGDHMIDVQLEDVNTPKSKGSQNGEWLTHPAFTFGGQELEGFWMAKFTTGYKDATSAQEAEINKIDATMVTIKPNNHSWRKLSLSNMYFNAFQMRDTYFGLIDTDDPHMSKNMEWGAMAYLSFSKYGIAGNSNYPIGSRAIRINNNNQFLTGCGADTPNAPSVSTCNSYETVNGQAASTTGNITGVYDIVGNANEYMMSGIKQPDGLFKLVDSEFQQATLQTIATNQKYFDSYEYGEDSTETRRGKLGDGTKELGPIVYGLSSWSADAYNFPFGAVSVFFLRNHELTSLDRAGIFALGYGTGGPWSSAGFRVVVI